MCVGSYIAPRDDGWFTTLKGIILAPVQEGDSMESESEAGHLQQK